MASGQQLEQSRVPGCILLNRTTNKFPRLGQMFVTGRSVPALFIWVVAGSYLRPSLRVPRLVCCWDTLRKSSQGCLSTPHHILYLKVFGHFGLSTGHSW
ncbi:hypothetical protein ACMYSQ_009907 [Aspergillus niger]